jgi:hypothetical protein
MRRKRVEIMTREAQLSTDRAHSQYTCRADLENFRISAMRVNAPYCQVTLPSVANQFHSNTKVLIFYLNTRSN